MNLDKIWQGQQQLMDHISEIHPEQPEENRFSKRILALYVELGECANEWRGFKFWSKDQEPRTLKSRVPYINLEDADFYNPLLEEYVDGLHFVVDLGISLGCTAPDWVFPEGREDVTECFNRVYGVIGVVEKQKTKYDFDILLTWYIHLGASLGFEWDEIEASYWAKNAINHKRQVDGY